MSITTVHFPVENISLVSLDIIDVYLFECPAFTMMFQNLAQKFCFEKIKVFKLSNDLN